MQRVKRDNPEEDIRFIFQRDQLIRRGSKTSYSSWAMKNGFEWAIGESVPQEWIEEKGHVGIGGTGIRQPLQKPKNTTSRVRGRK